MSKPRTDDLLPSHPGEPYPYPTTPRVEEKDIQGSVVPSTFAPGLVPVQIVSVLPTLPDPLWPQGYVVFLTTDNKLYRSTGTVWTVAVPTVDLTGQVTSAQITDLAVTTAKLNDLAVSTAKIAALAVDTGKLAALAVDSTKLADLAVTNAKIALLAVDTAQIAASAVSTAKIAALAVDNGKIAALAVDTAKLANDAVTTAKIAALAVTTGELAALAVTNAKIADTTITAGKLVAHTITANEIAALTITAAEIAAGTITGAKIAALTITSSLLAADSVIAGKIAAKAIGVRELFVGSFDNLIPNPGFEANGVSISPWVVVGGGTGTWSLTTSNTRSGANAVLFDPTGQTNTAQLDSHGTAAQGKDVHLLVTEGDQIYFEMWGRKVGVGTPNQVNISIGWRDKDNVFLAASQVFGGATTLTQAYSRLFVSGTAPAGAVYSQLIMTVINQGNAETLVFDDAYARRMVTGSIVVDGTITATQIAAGTITAAKIAALTITAAEIAAGTITGAKIAAVTITAANIAALTITAAEIAASTITGAKIAAATITAANIAALTITAAEIAAGTITGAKIAAATITAANIQALTITAAEIAASTITGAKIAAATITAANIAALTITAGELAADSVTTNKILAGAVTAAKITVSTLSSIVADIGTITTGLLRDTNSKFVADLANALLTVVDGQGSPITRVKLGKLGAGATDYGLEIYDASGNPMFTANGLGAQAMQQVSQVGTNLVVNGDFELGTAFWRQTSGSDCDRTTSTPIEGVTSGLITTVASTTHRIQQCDRSTDVVDSGSGNPVYLAVQPFDEMWGYLKFKSNAFISSDAANYIKIGVEEYDSAKALIQRTYFANADWGIDNSIRTLVGGILLTSTTRYVVPIIEAGVSGSAGGFTLRLDAAKMSRFPARYRCLAYKSGGTQSLTSGTEAAVSLDAETYDVGTLHDNASNNTRITVPADIAGRGGIRLHGQATFAANGTGYRLLRWRKNGSTYLASTRVMTVTTASTTTEVQCVARDDRPAVGDYYELMATQNSGGALNVLNGTREVTFAEAIHDQ